MITVFLGIGFVALFFVGMSVRLIFLNKGEFKVLVPRKTLSLIQKELHAAIVVKRLPQELPVKKMNLK